MPQRGGLYSWGLSLRRDCKNKENEKRDAKKAEKDRNRRRAVERVDIADLGADFAKEAAQVERRRNAPPPQKPATSAASRNGFAAGAEFNLGAMSQRVVGRVENSRK